MKQVTSQVVTIEALTEVVYRVVLALPERLNFTPGQYLQVVMGERDKRPFSIASTATELPQLELHIGAHPDNAYATEVLERMREHGQIEVELPLGSASLIEPVTRPLILIAGGTGFSYTWSILQAYLAQAEQPQPVTLYWGAKQLSDLYYHERLQKLAERYAQFSYRPVLEYPNADWSGATGLVHMAVLAEQAELAHADIYVAGRFEMVRVIRDAFVEQGLPLTQLHGDALAFI